MLRQQTGAAISMTGDTIEAAKPRSREHANTGTTTVIP